MAKVVCITSEESLLGFNLLGIEVLKIREEKELDYGKIESCFLIIVEDRFYNLLKERFPEKIIFPLSGLKGENFLLRKNLKDFVFKATAQRIEL